MGHVLHEIEKKIISALGGGELDASQIQSATGLSADQVRRGTEWLRLKNLAAVSEERRAVLYLGANGMEAYSEGLPERRLLNLLEDGPRSTASLQSEMGPAFGAAMGIARRGGWVTGGGGSVRLAGSIGKLPGEDVIRQLGRKKIPKTEVSDAAGLAALAGRPDYIIEQVTKSRRVRLLEGAAGAGAGTQDAGAIDVEADAPEVFPARVHPLSETIEEIRDAFVTLGFMEVAGGLSQPSFWNFDALFTPQDHPAREMQDTFYIEGARQGRFATAEQVRRVAAAHEKNWGYAWSAADARRTVLRTHTTCVTIRHLAEQRPSEARVFSLGRVFRNEKVSYKHLAEFNQVEGVVVGADATLRNLMGIQKEFYNMIGLERVKFWPTFFPYTEPSLQTMVYNKRLKKWVELFGMGILRPEVTDPLGIDGPVLAWGGGIERIAMIKYGVDDVRQFYNNDLGWLRGAAICR